LRQDPNERLPLIKIFVHPWVAHFQDKYKITRAPTPDASASVSESSDAYSEDKSDEEVITPKPLSKP
jgi:hypothetical protein